MTATDAFEIASYRTDDGTALALHVFRPTAGSRRCVVLVIHGGGWRGGAPEIVHGRAAALAAAGFTAIAMQYRLLDAAPWPAPLADAAAALAWIRDHATALDIDPAHVAVQGHSAGGHIALMTGTLAPDIRPAAIVAYYPAIGFYPAAAPTAATPPLGAENLDELGRMPGWSVFPLDASEAELDAASPIALVTSDFPPTILFQGTADTIIHERASITLHRRLTDLGVLTDLHVYAGRDHEFDRAPSMLPATTAATASFLDRMVTNRAEADAETRRFVFTIPPA